MKKIFLLAFAFLFTQILNINLCFAQQKILAYYNTGKTGSITFEASPDTLRDLSGNGYNLHKQGAPLFFADAPPDKRLKGEGSVLFNGSASYTIKKSITAEHGKFIVETWVKANTIDNNDDHLGETFAVVAYGDDKGGYQIAQQGSNWVAVVDGSKIYVMAPVTVGAWVHLTMVGDGNKNALYVNGKNVGSFAISRSVSDNFSLGDATDKKHFHGLIYEARLSSFTGAYNAKYLLLNTAEIAKTEKLVSAQQKDLINALSKNEGIISVAAFPDNTAKKDWLVEPVSQPVHLYLQKAKDGLSAMFRMENGLVSRDFLIADNIACVSYKNLYNNAEYIRAVKPEVRVMLDSTLYNIGGLTGQPEKAYLLQSWYKDLVSDPNSFVFAGIDVTQPEMRYNWQQKFNAVAAEWPPKGLHVVMHYKVPFTDSAKLKGLQIDVHYEMYEGAPIIAKWFTVKNNSSNNIVVNKMDCEVLAVNQDQLNRILVQSDYSFAAENNSVEGSGSTLYPSEDVANPARFGYTTTHWEVDPDYNTWATQEPEVDVMFLKNQHRCLLLSKTLFGPGAHVQKDSVFQSFTTFELLQDSDDKERQLLGERKLLRRLAPQVTESLLCGGITSNDPVKLKGFIDQMGELGFERLDVMAWPGISHDNLDPQYVGLWKNVADYAAAKNIVVGGYELQVASRGRGTEYDVIDPKTNKSGSFFGESVCIASKWQDVYYPKMWKFFDQTGLKTLNVDGPYHGDPCASTIHPHHSGYYDSQWEQWKFQVSVVHELQRRNMYVPMPDAYFLNGSCATGMGYREASANLTPQQQLLLGRQYIYDGTWYKAPTMGWMTLQLVGFYSDDPNVGLEPLSKNISRYETGLFQHLASGCQFTVRGNRLYDTPETKAMVTKWVGWFKKYRDILTSDIIHIGRPTGRDLDAMFHVNPKLKTKGMLILFNPTDQPIERNFTIPMYYTGIKTTATIKEKEGEGKAYTVDKNGNIVVSVLVKANGFTWLQIE